MATLMKPLRAILERAGLFDHDIEKVALTFGVERKKLDSVIADLAFNQVDPMRDPLEVADERLQSRLEILCEALRAKY